MIEKFVIRVGNGFLKFDYNQHDSYHNLRFVDTAEEASEIFDKQAAMKFAKEKGGKAYKKMIRLEETS